MPVPLILFITKLILKVSRLLGRGGGSALPGLVAERLDPYIGRKLAAGLRGGSIIITGTNGKTTTSKMLAAALADGGKSLIQNRAGSNLSRGIVSTLIEHASITGKFKQTDGLFEVDEAAMPAVCRMLQPHTIVVLNLFRDQLDRYGELDTTAGFIGKGIAATKASLILNADDPLVAGLSQYGGERQIVTYFGVERAPVHGLATDATADSTSCPVCGATLIFSTTFYGHIGHYNCPKKHFKRPQPTITALVDKLDATGTILSVEVDNDTVNTTSVLPGVYNVYNVLAATATAIATMQGISLQSTAKSIAKVDAAFGRVEQLSIEGKSIYLLLVKNPTGFNQIIQTFMLQKKHQKALIIINDNYADGRDVSWLWDVSFEEMVSRNHTLATSGIRATDMALRLKYAGMPTAAVNSDIQTSLNHFIAQIPAGGTGYIIPTYTAMLETRKLLGKKVKLAGVWE